MAAPVLVGGAGRGKARPERGDWRRPAARPPRRAVGDADVGDGTGPQWARPGSSRWPGLRRTKVTVAGARIAAPRRPRVAVDPGRDVDGRTGRPAALTRSTRRAAPSRSRARPDAEQRVDDDAAASGSARPSAAGPSHSARRARRRPSAVPLAPSSATIDREAPPLQDPRRDEAVAAVVAGAARTSTGAPGRSPATASATARPARSMRVNPAVPAAIVGPSAPHLGGGQEPLGQRRRRRRGGDQLLLSAVPPLPYSWQQPLLLRKAISGAARPVNHAGRRPAHDAKSGSRAVNRAVAGGPGHEEDRSDHQAVQARRGEGGPAGGRPPGHHRDRGQGLRPPEGPHRTLSRRRIRRRLPAQDEDRDRARPTTWSRAPSRRSARPPRPAASATARSSYRRWRRRSASAPARPARTRSDASRPRCGRPAGGYHQDTPRRGPNET